MIGKESQHVSLESRNMLSFQKLHRKGGNQQAASVHTSSPQTKGLFREEGALVNEKSAVRVVSFIFSYARTARVVSTASRNGDTMSLTSALILMWHKVVTA